MIKPLRAHIATCLAVCIAASIALAGNSENAFAASGSDLVPLIQPVGSTQESTLQNNARIPQQTTQETADTAGSLGVGLTYSGSTLTVYTVLHGTAALYAGLKQKDQILSINGTDVTGGKLADAFAMLRGPVGSHVTLQIKRGDRLLTLDAIRSINHGSELSTRMYGKIAIINILQFGIATEKDFPSIIQGIANKHPSGIILDLRNNSNGYLDDAKLVADAFLPQGSPLAWIYQQKNKPYLLKTDQPPVIAATTPVIILTSIATAGEAEIVASALQESHRATIIGEHTFGANTTNGIGHFADGSYRTEAPFSWLTANATDVLKTTGVHPDVVVLQTANITDTLLQKAIRMLQK
ncbi:MAG TPA: S41 family peptidase [Candidatus Peribacteraceae bacterium]|nr:S41 family peptidase [Candidatus Peribacteraceae bacterium]